MHPAIAAYDEAYSTADPSAIATLVGDAFTEGGMLESPHIETPVVGHDALVEHIRTTRARLKGTQSRHTSPVERVGNTLRWTWAFEIDGVMVAEGMDVALLSEDERIERLVIFDGLTPTL